MVLSMKRGAAVLCSLLVAVLTWEALPGVGSSAVAAASTDWEEAAFERKEDPLTVTNLRGLEEAVRTRFKRCRERERDEARENPQIEFGFGREIVLVG
jgi:hypothetical protein